MTDGKSFTFAWLAALAAGLAFSGPVPAGERQARGGVRHEVAYDSARFVDELAVLSVQTPDAAGTVRRAGALAALAPRHVASGQSTAAVFPFGSNRSPTIVAGYGPEADAADAKPVRNPNLYRKVKNGARRPAEVLVGKPIPPGLFSMTASGDNRVRRAEVLLPSLPPGIGMDHELAPLR